jgi:hypothetical protein
MVRVEGRCCGNPVGPTGGDAASLDSRSANCHGTVPGSVTHLSHPSSLSPPQACRGGPAGRHHRGGAPQAAGARG